MTVAAVHVQWTRAEVTFALDAVLSESPHLAGRKQALEQLERASRKLADKKSP